MSDSTTDLHDKLHSFMSQTPQARDEMLWFQFRELKTLLVENKLLTKVDKLNTIMQGTEHEAGLLVRFNDLQRVVERLVKSNARLQAAMYVCTGAYAAVKFYFEFIAPHHP